MKTNKHFLLAVGKDISHQYGVRFLSYFFSNKNDILIDILNIANNPEKSGYYYPVQNQTSTESNQLFLQEIQQRLHDFGFPRKNIRTDSRKNTISTVKDIINYGRKGLYDSLVLGRRGLTLLENLIQDSVSSKVLDEQCDIPIWICREPQRHKKHLLLCTDGSQQSLNTADHVGFVLNSAPEHDITVLYVRSGSPSANEQEIIDSTVSSITENNFPGDRISVITLQGSNAARVILNYASDNNYAVIAMGRKCRTAPGKGLSRFFVGSVSGEVLNKLESSSLWICK